jgi:hypothetical protein
LQLRGTPKYEKFYGRSKGSLSGGFIGKAPVVSEENKALAISKIKNNLQARLLKNAINQTPNGFILFKNAIFLDTNDSNITSSYGVDKSMVFKIKGTLYGILFNEQKITKQIAEKNIEKYDGSNVFISNIKDLTFNTSNKENISFADLKGVDFNLSGSVKIIWKIDTDKLVTDLLGKSKKAFNEMLSQYESIDSATLKITPFWRNTIPDKIKNIKISANYPN